MIFLEKKRSKRKNQDQLSVWALLIVLVAGISLFQYGEENVRAEKYNLKINQHKLDGLPKIFIKKENSNNNVLRSENDDGGIKNNLTGKYSLNQILMRKNIREIVGNKPMRSMISKISQRDEKTASYLVAIAKHESNLGKFSPKKDGKDCYNYWGYRGTYNQTKSGYSCFDSPEQAVFVVGNRIQSLIALEKVENHQSMLVWKCGSTCAGHDAEDVKNWLKNVSFYYEKASSLPSS